jgi:hypothetical protein
MAFQFQPPPGVTPRAVDLPRPTQGPYAEFRAWCKGRSWFIRLPVWLYLAYVGWLQYQDPENYASLFSGINLGIHEGGHLLFRPFGIDVLHVAGGTIAQLGAPIISMVILWQQRDYFGLTFCLGWLSTNLIGVGVYMADARALELPLVSAEGGGGPTIHDWNWLFGYFGLLNDDVAIGLATRGLGSAVMILALLTGAWIMWEMHRAGGAGKWEE